MFIKRTSPDASSEHNEKQQQAVLNIYQSLLFKKKHYEQNSNGHPNI